MSDIKAYRTSVHGVVCIVFTTTRGKARHVTALAAKDAGYKTEFTEVQAYRAPEYDGRKTMRGNIPVLDKCLTPTFLEATP